MKSFIVGRPFRYRFSSAASGGFASTPFGALAVVIGESTSSVSGDAIILQPFCSLSSNQFLRVQLQPRPELNLDRAGDSPRHDVEYAFPAAKNLRLTGHLRLEQERAVVDPGRNQDRLGVDVGATESGGTRGRLSGRSENGAGTGAGIDLGDRGNGGDRPAKSLVGMRSGLEQDLSPHFHVSNVLLGNDDLRRNRFDIVNLGDQISLLHQLVFHLLQLNGGRSHDSGDWTAHLRQLNLLLQK